MFRIGQPVIFYQRRKENPLKDKTYTAIITDVQTNIRRERTMFKLYRCNLNHLTEEEYETAIKDKLGTYKRANFVIPYDPRIYQNILEWIWQVRYLLTEKVYDMFPVKPNKTASLVDKIKKINGKEFKEEAKEAIGFNPEGIVESKDFNRGYKMIDYKRIAKGYRTYKNNQARKI
jgi:hypothetical protein